MAGDLVAGDQTILKDLLTFCQVRGEDSTGVFSVRKTVGTFDHIKQVGTPNELFAMKRYEEVVRPFSSRALIGHCRKATLGKVIRQNAHPFQVDHVIGVHNGSLRGRWEDLPRDGEKYEVDSNALIAALGQRDPKEVLEEVNGAVALIWYNAKDDTLYLARNDERPLWYCWNKTQRKIFWASEQWMLDVALDRGKTEVYTDEKGFGYWPVPKNKIIALALSSKHNEKPVTIVSQTPFESKGTVWGQQGNFSHHGWSGNQSGRLSTPSSNTGNTPSPNARGTLTTVDHTKTGGSSGSGTVVPFDVRGKTLPPESQSTDLSSTLFQRCLADSNSSTAATTPDPTITQPSRSNSNVVGLDGQRRFWEALETNEDGVALFDNEVKGPSGLILSETAFNSLVAGGCSFCQRDIDFADEKAGRGVHHWVDAKNFVCRECIPNNDKGSKTLIASVVNS